MVRRRQSHSLGRKTELMKDLIKAWDIYKATEVNWDKGMSLTEEKIDDLMIFLLDEKGISSEEAIGWIEENGKPIPF